MATYNISVSGTSANVTVANSTKVRLVSNVAIHFATGPASTTVTAFTSNCEMVPANTSRFIPLGLGDKLAVIGAVGTSAGVCNITEIGSVSYNTVPLIINNEIQMRTA